MLDFFTIIRKCNSLSKGLQQHSLLVLKNLVFFRYKMEKELSRTRDEMEKEIERKLKTRQLQDTLTAQQMKFDDATKRLEDEDRFRKMEAGRSLENEKIALKMKELKRENEGLRIKIQALEENNTILKNMKDEGQSEIDRLRRSIEDLRLSVIEASKRDPVPAPQLPQPPPRNDPPIIWTLPMREEKREPAPPPPPPAAPPAPVAPPQPVTLRIEHPPQPQPPPSPLPQTPVRDYAFEDEKRRLKELRKGLEKQEKVII